MPSSRPVRAGAVFLLACATLVIAGDVDPPPGPVGDSGPSLADILGAAGGASAGTPVVLSTIAGTPAFSTVTEQPGVLRRALITSVNGNPPFVTLRDATGVIAQLFVPTADGSRVFELGVRYQPPLEVAFVDAPDLHVMLVVEED